MPLSTKEDVAKATSAYDFTVLTAKKQEYNLSQRNGKPTLVVNVALHWGFTEKGLPLAGDLFQKYKNRGFEVLGFPCNQFHEQNPEDAEETYRISVEKHKADFPMMYKVDVNGKDANPLWIWMKKQMPGVFGTEGIKWNFTWFLLDGAGRVVERYAPNPSMQEVEKKLVPLLRSPDGCDDRLIAQKSCCCC